MRLAITGAAGFLGGRVVARARAMGHDVSCVLRPSHPAADGPTLRVDLGEGAALEPFLAGMDAVIHAAGRVSAPDPSAFTRDNPVATGEIAQAARAVGARLVHVSSTAVYGDRAAERGPVDEDTPLGYQVDRWDPYAHSKIEAERRVEEVAGLRWVVIRPGLILGPGGRSHRPLRALASLPLVPLVGRGRNRLPLCHVDSVADALLLAAEEPAAEGQAFNIAGDWPVTQRQLLTALAPGRPRFLPLPYRALLAAGLVGDVLGARLPVELPWGRAAAALLGLDGRFSTDKAERVLGWTPAWSFEEAVRTLD